MTISALGQAAFDIKTIPHTLIYQIQSSFSIMAFMPELANSSFSVPVMKRILDTLLENGPMKKTNLAGRCGLNYPTCMRYLRFMTLIKWLEQTDDANNYVVITEMGRHVNSLFSEALSDLRQQYHDGYSIAIADTAHLSKSRTR